MSVRTKVLNIRLNVDEYEAVSALADETDCSFGYLVRRLVKEETARRRAKALSEIQKAVHRVA